MTLLVDETFASGLPGGFASLAAAGGSPAQSHDAGALAAQITNGNFNTAWVIDSVAAQPQLAIEINVEITAQTYAGLALGFFLRQSAGSGNQGLTIHHNLLETLPNDWYSYAAPTGIANALSLVNNRFVPGSALYRPYIGALNERRTMRLDWDATRMQYMVSIDGSPLYILGGSSEIGFTAATAFAGIYFRGCTVLVHSVKLWDIASLPAANGRVFDKVGRASTAQYLPVEIDETRVLNPWARGAFPGIPGGTIAGTVLIDDTPDTPVSRRVYLLDSLSGEVVATTYSEPVTGHYEFRGLHTTRLYTVLSRDTSNIYNTAVKDRITPVAA